MLLVVIEKVMNKLFIIRRSLVLEGRLKFFGGILRCLEIRFKLLVAKTAVNMYADEQTNFNLT